MKQQGIDNLKNAIHIGDAISNSFGNINRAVSEGKYDEAQDQVGGWKKQASALQDQIDDQLSLCKKLRKNTILKSLYEEDRGTLLARKTRGILTFLKHDIVNLNHNFPDLAYELSPSKSKLIYSEGDQFNDGEDSMDHNLLGGGEGKSECVSGKRRKKKYNELTKSQLIEKELTELFEEIDSSREHMEGKNGEDFVDVEGLLKLYEVRSRMLSNILFDILKRKRAMDRSFGYDEDFRKLRRPEHGESADVFKITELVKVGLDMIDETKSSRMALAADSEDTMHRLVSENRELKKKYAKCAHDMNRMERRLKEFISQKPLSTIDRIKMEEAILERNKIEKELDKANDVISKARLKQNLMQDKIKILTDEAMNFRTKLKERTEW